MLGIPLFRPGLARKPRHGSVKRVWSLLRKKRAVPPSPLRAPMPSVLIVDNHLLIRIGLRRMLSQEHRGLVIGEAKSAEEAETCLDKRAWDFVILALALPGQDGFYVLQEIRRRSVPTRVLVLTMHADLHYAVRAREMGASGYICKDAGRGELLRAI